MPRRQHYGDGFDKMQISSRHDLVVIVPGDNGCHRAVMADPDKSLWMCSTRISPKQTNKWKRVCVCVSPKKQTDTQEAVVCFVRIVRVGVCACSFRLCVCVRDDRAEAPGEDRYQ